VQCRWRDLLLLRKRPERYELLLDEEGSAGKTRYQDDPAFQGVLNMSLKQKVSMRDAAYMVAIDRVVKAMQLRGWV